jgi:hypothetical protein
LTHSGGRILYLALADGRGHLMRAHLMRQALGRVDIGVDIVTTGREGVRFLEGLGTPSALLSEHFRVEFGDRHDMSWARTDRRIFNYLVLPWRALDDLRKLALWARGTDLVVNDSLHPALLLAPVLGFPFPVVQLYGENLWRAMEDNFDHRAPAWVGERYRQSLRWVRDRAFARIVHALGETEVEERTPPRTFRLAPVVARPARSRAEVRSALEVPGGVPLAAVYLNPHFRDPSIAQSVEDGLRMAGFQIHAVGEGYTRRPGWWGSDGSFGDVVHAAELFVSGAGMGALELARSSGTPLLVLLGDQPEQARNVAELRRRAPDFALHSVLVGDPDLSSSIAEAARTLSRRWVMPLERSGAETAWVEVFQGLLHSARQRAAAQHRLRAAPRPALGSGFT